MAVLLFPPCLLAGSLLTHRTACQEVFLCPENVNCAEIKQRNPETHSVPGLASNRKSLVLVARRSPVNARRAENICPYTPDKLNTDRGSIVPVPARRNTGLENAIQTGREA